MESLRSRLPGLLALYAFGSSIEGREGPASDLDRAVLAEGHVAPLDSFPKRFR